MIDGHCRAALALALCVTACAPALPAGHVAGPANGFLIIGTAERTLATSVFFQTRHFTLTLAQGEAQGGQTVAVTHRGCTSYEGLFAGEPCTREDQPGWQVLELPPGDWRAVGLHLDVRSGFPAQDGTVDVALPGLAIHVAPGEAVYAGDFVFGVDPAARTGSVLAHGRNDDAAARALAAVPAGARGFTYRDPTGTPG